MAIEIKTCRTCETRVCQGDILRDVEHIESVVHQGEYIDITKAIFPRVIVLTQDCDLQQDFRFRTSDPPKPTLVSVLVAPLYLADHVFAGEHLSFLNVKLAAISKNQTPGKTLMQNDTPRYHYLAFDAESRMPPLIIDFKQYFSVSVEYLKEQKPASL